jgi:hypothetical protein
LLVSAISAPPNDASNSATAPVQPADAAQEAIAEAADHEQPTNIAVSVSPVLTQLPNVVNNDTISDFL